MREFACTPILDVWYSRFDVEAVLAGLRSEMPRKAVRQTEAHRAKARARDRTDSTQAVAKLTKVVDERRKASATEALHRLVIRGTPTPGPARGGNLRGPQ
jgi:hypothetical protein